MNRDILPKLSSAEMLKHLQKFDNIGNKWAGTRGETQTKDYLYEVMKGYGLETRIEEFPYLKYSNPRTTVAIKSPIQKELNCLPVSYFANKRVEGEAIFVGTGTKEEFETVKKAGTDFKGKVVVAISDAPFMLTPAVEECGAVALLTICLTPEPGMIRHCCASFYMTTEVPTMPKNVLDFIADITGAMIPITPDGNLLLALMSAGKVKLEIFNEATYEPATSWNIIGDIKGTERPNEKVVIGAHYDSEFNVPGVGDNGSGGAGVLEIARAIKAAKIPLKRTMVFCHYGCEENGCWGSADHVARYKEDFKKNIIAMFNLDYSVNGIRHALWASDEIKDFLVEVAEALQWRVDAMRGVDLTFSDYAPFRDINVPNCWIWQYPPIHPYYHTELDNLMYQPPMGELVACTEVTALAALELATTDKRL